MSVVDGSSSPAASAAGGETKIKGEGGEIEEGAGVASGEGVENGEGGENEEGGGAGGAGVVEGGEESATAASPAPPHVSSADHWLDVEGMDRGDHVTSLRHADTPLAGASSAAARREDRRRLFEGGESTAKSSSSSSSSSASASSSALQRVQSQTDEDHIPTAQALCGRVEDIFSSLEAHLELIQSQKENIRQSGGTGGATGGGAGSGEEGSEGKEKEEGTDGGEGSGGQEERQGKDGSGRPESPSSWDERVWNAQRMRSLQTENVDLKLRLGETQHDLSNLRTLHSAITDKVEKQEAAAAAAAATVAKEGEDGEGGEVVATTRRLIRRESITATVDHCRQQATTLVMKDRVVSIIYVMQSKQAYLRCRAFARWRLFSYQDAVRSMIALKRGEQEEAARVTAEMAEGARKVLVNSHTARLEALENRHAYAQEEMMASYVPFESNRAFIMEGGIVWGAH